MKDKKTQKYYYVSYYCQGNLSFKEVSSEFLNCNPFEWAAKENDRMKKYAERYEKENEGEHYAPAKVIITDWREITKAEYEAGLKYLESLK